MYFGDPRRRSLPSARSDGAAIESAAVKQTLTETKRLDTRPKYPKRCKEKYQKNLFRLSFKPDLAPLKRKRGTFFSDFKRSHERHRKVPYLFRSWKRCSQKPEKGTFRVFKNMK